MGFHYILNPPRSVKSVNNITHTEDVEKSDKSLDFQHRSTRDLAFYSGAYGT